MSDTTTTTNASKPKPHTAPAPETAHAAATTAAPTVVIPASAKRARALNELQAISRIAGILSKLSPEEQARVLEAVSALRKET